MKNITVDELKKVCRETSAFKNSITRELVETQHQTGSCAKHLSKLNSILAMLEASHEPDEIVARKLDQLKLQLDETEHNYRQLQSREHRLQKAEVDAINQLKDAEDALKLEQLKSGRNQ